MNWKYEAIEKLKEYSAKRQALNSIPEEMARLESAMQSIRSATADGTPVSGGGSGREDMLLSNIVHREELARSLEQARKWVSLVDSGLEVLTDDERKVLDRFYIKPARGNVDRFAKNLGLKSLRFMRERIRRFTILQFACTDAQKSEKPEKNRKIFQFECAILVKKKKRKRLGIVPEPLFAWRGR